MNNETILDLVLETNAADTDSYKFTHYKQTPPGTRNVMVYGEARGTKLNWDNPRTLMFGAQMFIQKYLTKPITHEQIDAMKILVSAHGFPGFNEEGFRYIVDNHDGYLPIKIRAVKEGTVVPLSNVLYTIEATDDKCYWLPPYIETMFLRAIWYPVTVASNSFRAKEIIKRYLDETSEDTAAELPFKLHDFGARGATCKEQSMIGGAAHLVNFMGTDTFLGAVYAMKYYKTFSMPGFSIDAAEHFTVIAWGEENEAKAYKNMLDTFGGDGKMVAVVSDSYDIYNAVDNIWGVQLKEDVENMGGVTIIRPDSGDPLVVPVEIIEKLMDKFGYTVNSKGYKVLPDYLRVIQGDGITVDNIERILANMKIRGLSASNIAFGMGAGLLQKLDRDTYMFAQKASSVKINGKWIDTFKSPITDNKKASKKGRLTLVKNTETGEFRTIQVTDPIKENEVNVMRTIYDNGVRESELLTFEEVRAEAEKYLT